MAVKYLSDGGPDGVSVGQSTTDLVAFYGNTPIARPTTAITALTTTTLTTITDIVTTASMTNAINAIVSRVNSINAAFNNLAANLSSIGIITR